MPMMGNPFTVKLSSHNFLYKNLSDRPHTHAVVVRIHISFNENLFNITLLDWSFLLSSIAVSVRGKMNPRHSNTKKLSCSCSYGYNVRDLRGLRQSKLCWTKSSTRKQQSLLFLFHRKKRKKEN